MANTEFSNYIETRDPAAALDGTEEVVLSQGGNARKTTTQDIADLGAGGGGTVTSVTGTTDRITSSGGATPVINIDAAYDAAITAQIAAAQVGLWDDRGTFDASVAAYPSSGGSGTAGAIIKGDIWTVSVAGTLPTGQVVEIGDTVRALIDTPGNTQANWGILQNNIGFVPAPIASPTFTGVPAAPTAAPGTDTTQIATTEFVQAIATELGDLTVGSITGAVSLVSGDLGTLWEMSGTTTDYTVDLPTAVGNAEKTIIFKGLAALTKNVTISGISGQTIDGVTTRVMGGGGSLTLLSDGANWQIVNEIGSWINYTPVWSGFSADPTVGRAVYFRVGKMCTVHLNTTASGTSNATTLTVTLPFASKYHAPQPAIAVNNGSTVTAFGRIDPLISSSVANCYISAGAGVWTATGGKRISFMITYEVE